MVTFRVKITGKDMFNYNVYHNYRHFEGIMSLILGIVLLALCAFSVKEKANISYVLITGFLGLFMTILTPLRIWIKSYQQVALNATFKEPIDYTVSEDELLIVQGALRATFPMSEVIKVVDTKKSIVLYVSKIRAYIFPKDQVGAQLEDLIEVLKDSDAKRVRL